MQDYLKKLTDRFNVEIEPQADAVCSQCKRPILWFWLESESPNEMKSRWMPHQCVCGILGYLHGKKSYIAATAANEQKAENLMSIKRKTAVLDYLIGKVRLCRDTEEYLKNRFHIARGCPDIDSVNCGWWWLMDCRDENEARQMVADTPTSELQKGGAPF